MRLLFYSAFTSHVEVASTVSCDSLVAAHLLYDWFYCAFNDYALRMNLNRLRSGDFAIASLPRRDGRGAGSATTRPHQE